MILFFDKNSTTQIPRISPIRTFFSFAARFWIEKKTKKLECQPLGSKFGMKTRDSKLLATEKNDTSLSRGGLWEGVVTVVGR